MLTRLKLDDKEALMTDTKVEWYNRLTKIMGAL